MNIDFGADPTFSSYVLLLMLSGIVMVIMATPKVRSTPFLRLLNVVLGLGFFGYGFYLAFLFQGTSYFLFFQAFIVPIALVLRTVQGALAARRAAARIAPPQAEPEQAQPQPQI
jgi:hypothetical protein